MKNVYFNALDKYCGTFARTAAMLGACAALFGTSPAFSATEALGAATSPDGKTRLDVVSLKRTEGDTVTLRFQVTNDGTVELKLYTIYAPPQHAPGTIHKTKAEADLDEADHPAVGATV